MISFLKDMFAGAMAAAISETIVAPLERVKIILQVQEGSKHHPERKPYKGMIDCFIRIPREQGVLSLWRGNLAHILRCWPSYAFNFAFKDKYQQVFTKGLNKETQFWKYFGGNVAAGGLAGATTLTLFYPLDYIETRLAADTGSNVKHSHNPHHHHHPREFSGIIHCFHKTVKTDGFVGLYRGYWISVQGAFVYRATYFGCFDTAKGLLPNYIGNSFLVTWMIAQIVTTIAGFVAYPLDTVRRRMMMQSCLSKADVIYKSTFDCWIKIFVAEGLRGYFKGAWSNILRSTGGALILVFYDTLRPSLYSS